MLDTVERVFCFVKSFHHPYSNWIIENLDNYNYKEILLDRIYQELRHDSPKEDLPDDIKTKLEKLPIDERKELISRTKDGSSVLFVACKKGNLDVVKFLIEVCNADPEQIGIYEVVDEQTVHRVTPLWAAAVSGHLNVVEYLVLKAKVDINSCSDSGSTVVRSCCYMLHYDIVNFLIQNGADISKANEYGGNCLINSVTSYKLCKLLLEHGADVNACDLQNKTALHYSIHEHNFEVSVLLLNYGADPTITTRNGEDALCSACLKMEINTFNYLIKNVHYTNERIANAYELIGCSILDEHKDVKGALEYWHKALLIRSTSEPRPIVKRNLVPPKKVYQYVTEFQTHEELDSLSTNIDLIRIQSLLICERILGADNRNTVFRLMYRGASYLDNLQYRRCISLWKYSLELRFKIDSIFHSESSFGAQALVRQFLYLSNSTSDLHDESLQFDDVYETLELFYNQFDFAVESLKIQPVYKEHLKYFDEILKMSVNLLYILNKIQETKEHYSKLVRIAVKLIKFDPRTSQGDSLLHLVVSSGSNLKSTFEMNADKLFPNHELSQLLLSCGADPNTINKIKNAPLHLACTRLNYDKRVVDLLLDNGAHLDQSNFNGNQPLKQLLSIKESKIEPMKYISLKCLAARKVNQIYSSHKEKFRNREASFLEDFVNLH